MFRDKNFLKRRMTGWKVNEVEEDKVTEGSHRNSSPIALNLADIDN
jgi:hypothetical protein